MSTTQKIYILIGQKGSGKSLAGKIIQDKFGLKFVRVEEIAGRVKKGRAVDDESYHKDVFIQIETHLRKVLEDESSVVFESTGLGVYFDNMLKSFNRDFKVITIRINAEPELCLQRIKSRDQSLHINVSDEDVIRINEMVRLKSLTCDYTLSNNGNREELINSLKNIFTKF